MAAGVPVRSGRQRFENLISARQPHEGSVGKSKQTDAIDRADREGERKARRAGKAQLEVLDVIGPQS
jgi:hypothetical protein